jgi:uncharacterized membrane protein
MVDKLVRFLSTDGQQGAEVSTKTDPRIVELEARLAVLHRRVIHLEQLGGVTAAEIQRVAAPPAPPPPPRVEPQREPRPVRPPHAPRPVQAQRPAPRPAPKPVELPDLEDLLGGRVLAWIGGVAVVLGLAFFFALAVSRGWINEGARCLIGTLVSSGLLTLGIWLREERGRVEASMAAAAAGLAGLFIAIVVATQVYELVPALVGLGLALGVGALGTALAIRWNAPVIGAIGTIGSVLAPALAGADADPMTVALLWVATAAGAAVLVYKQWSLLGVALFVVSAPQWLPWTVGTANPLQALVALLAFGVAGLTAAVGFELRCKAPALRRSAAVLMAANSLVVAIAGAIAFGQSSNHDLIKVWLAGLAAVHAFAGASMHFEKRISVPLRTICVGLAVVLADAAWGTIVDGPAMAIGWALSAVGFAWAMSRTSIVRVERQAAVVGLGGQISLALVRILTQDARVADVSSPASVDSIVALASLAAACLLSARFAEEGDERLRQVLDTAGLIVLAYLTLYALDGVALVAAFAAQACALAAVARARDDVVSRTGAMAYLGIAGLHALVVEAPPEAFLYGAPDVLAMLGALGAVTLATLRVVTLSHMTREWLTRARAGAAATALYAISIAIISAFQPGADQASMVLDLGVRQEGQMIVSGLWSLIGAVTLVIGLSRGSRELRMAGLAVLVASVAKVFLFDLATLTSIYRVASLIALGLLLLAGSYAWQRSRPAPLPDLRKA